MSCTRLFVFSALMLLSTLAFVQGKSSNGKAIHAEIAKKVIQEKQKVLENFQKWIETYKKAAAKNNVPLKIQELVHEQVRKAVEKQVKEKVQEVINSTKHFASARQQSQTAGSRKHERRENQRNKYQNDKERRGNEKEHLRSHQERSDNSKHNQNRVHDQSKHNQNRAHNDSKHTQSRAQNSKHTQQRAQNSNHNQNRAQDSQLNEYIRKIRDLQSTFRNKGIEQKHLAKSLWEAKVDALRKALRQVSIPSF
ncbi:unnamed protein product [Candidula unifasciata]|uniref:Uncharacterized protein n=1 Tax=Candidula unifasciata TaxID=100452 RepID=A0A8S3Z9P2_9EUPU|nr:unnamed protein product [Candidula unifasciata]